MMHTIEIKRLPPGWSILYYALLGIPLPASRLVSQNDSLLSYVVSFEDIVAALCNAGKFGEAAIVKKELRSRRSPPDALVFPANFCIEKGSPNGTAREIA